jgi:hypothetical protein
MAVPVCLSTKTICNGHICMFSSVCVPGARCVCVSFASANGKWESLSICLSVCRPIATGP